MFVKGYFVNLVLYKMTFILTILYWILSTDNIAVRLWISWIFAKIVYVTKSDTEKKFRKMVKLT